jgi:lipooligosaccharide transport system ATP-binding protein
MQQIERVGLRDQAHQLAGSLPLGKQRLVEIARALAADPVLLLLDEPAAGLRHAEKQDLSRLLRQLRDDHLSILLVEHDMEFVMGLVDRLVVMDKGKIMAEGTPSDLISRYSSREVVEVRFGSDKNAEIAPRLQGLGDRLEVLPDRILIYTAEGEAVLETLAHQGLHPMTSLVRRSSLEDVFLRLTGRSLVE